MIRSTRWVLPALASLSVLALAACAENPAEPMRGAAEFVKFATPVTNMPDFVQASRPAQRGDYIPVGVDAPARNVKPKDPNGVERSRKDLEDAAKANQAETGAKPKQP